MTFNINQQLSLKMIVCTHILLLSSGRKTVSYISTTRIKNNKRRNSDKICFRLLVYFQISYVRRKYILLRKIIIVGVEVKRQIRCVFP